MHALVLVTAALFAAASPQLRAPSTDELRRYPWLSASAAIRPLDAALPAPEGFTRIELSADSFGAWLRGLPLRSQEAAVRSFRGELLHAPGAAGVVAVAELDVGARDLQQCADSIIRLHAEWLWQAGRAGSLAYRFTSGDVAAWNAHARGERPIISGRKVRWAVSAKPDDSRAAFRAWLELVFQYAGTRSLDAYEQKVPRADVRPGDYFVTGGDPGHAVIVLDVAAAPDGRRVALIGQGFTPAQDFHVLAAPDGQPWFALEADAVATPFWKPFPWTSLRRFKDRR